MKKSIAALLAAVFLLSGCAFAYAQSTRSTMNSYNNTYIVSNGQGAITAPIMNGLFNEIINGAVLLSDTNTYTGLNLFINNPQLSGCIGIPVSTGSAPFTCSATLPVALGGTGATSLTANLPLIGNGTGAIAQGTVSGNTTEFATVFGGLTFGDCVQVGVNGNLVDAGSVCGGGGGGGTPGGTSGQVQFNNSGSFGGFTVSGDGSINTGTGTLTVTKTGGAAFGPLATITPGAGVQSALTIAAGGANGLALLNGSAVLSVTQGGTGTGTFTASLPVIGNGASTLTQGTVSGNTTKFATVTGSLTAGDCIQLDSNKNFVDAGGPCTTGGGGGTVSAGTAGNVSYYASSGTTVTGLANGTSSQVLIGGSAPTWGSVNLSTMASGALQAAQEPAHTGDMTNTAGSLATTVSKIGGISATLGGAFTTTGAFTLGLTTTGNTSLTLPTSGTVTAQGNTVTGSGSVVLATSPTLASPTVTGAFTATGLVTNADLANASTTVNGTTCTLGSTCSITAAANLTVGTTTVASGSSGYILYNNAGTLGNLATTGSGSVVLATSPTLTTPNLGTPTSLQLTNATGLPVGGLAGTGTGVTTALSNATNGLNGMSILTNQINVVCLNTSGDATLIQNAINALATTGGTVNIAPGLCSITSTINQPYANIWIKGAGSSQKYNGSSIPLGTVLRTTLASSDVLVIGAAAETTANYPQNCKVTGLTIQPNYATTTRTGGWGIHKYATNRCYFADLDIEDMWQGFFFDGTYSGVVNLDYNNTLENSFIEGNGEVGIKVGASGSTDAKWLPQNVFIRNTDISVNGTGGGCSNCAGLYVINVGGLSTYNIGGTGNFYGMLVQPATNQYVGQIFSVADVWDTNSGYAAVYINPNGGAVNSGYFSNLWGASTTTTHVGNGLGIVVTSGTATALTFNQCHFVNNAGYGAYVHGGSYINFTGCNMQVNSAASVGSFDGLSINGTASHVTVNGGIYGDTGYVFGNGGTVSRQEFGISVNGNANTLIEGVDSTGNRTASSGCSAAAFGALGVGVSCPGGSGTGSVIGGNM